MTNMSHRTTHLCGLTLLFQLLLTAWGRGSADEVLLMGFKNTSSGVAVSLVPSNHSLFSPISFLVADHFVPSLCGPRSFRCRNPFVLPPANSSSVQQQYVVMVPVTGGVLIMDWRRLASATVTLSSYVVKRVVGNDCDPLTFIRSATGTIYMVCASTTAVYLYTIGLNTTSISSTTIPGYLSQFMHYLSQPQHLLSNFIHDGTTLVHFLDGSSVYSFDLKNGLINEYTLIIIDTCDSPYKATYVQGSSGQVVVADCDSSNASAVIDLGAQAVSAVRGSVYPCTAVTDTWFYVYRLSNSFRVASGQHLDLLAPNRTEFHSAVCLAGSGYNVLVTLFYDIAESTFRVAVIDASAHWVTLIPAIWCPPSGCSMETSSVYLVIAGGDTLVFPVQNGSIYSDPLIEKKQFDLDLVVLLSIFNITNPLTPSSNAMMVLSSTTRHTAFPTNTLNPSTDADTIIAIASTVPVLLLLLCFVASVAVVLKRRRKNSTKSFQPSNCQQQHQVQPLELQSCQEDQATSQQQNVVTTIEAESETDCQYQSENGSGNQSCVQGGEPFGSSVPGQPHQRTSSNSEPVTAIEESSAQSLPYMVSGIFDSVPPGNIHPQNLIDQLPGEDRQNLYQSATM